MARDKEMQRRSVAFEPVEAGEGTMSGIAIVFDTRTTIGSGKYGFDEIIRRGAVEKALSRNSDVRALWNHDTNFVLGRTKNGTLALRVTPRGLEVTIRPPDTELAKHFHESVKRGDVDAMSFGFNIREENVTRGGGGDGRDLREILDIDLFEVSPVAFPAYPTTELQARRQPNPSAATLHPVSRKMRFKQLALRKRKDG